MPSKLQTVLLCGVLSIAATSVSAQSLECGQTYTVQSGDYLSSIASRAYGQGDLYTTIYNANVEIIGPDPRFLQIGQQLLIPCRDGSTAPTVQRDASVAPTPSIGSGTGSARAIRVLTATGWAPFMDEGQAEGGLLTDIINLALENADGAPDYKIDFVNDDGAHLNPLIVDHAYDISIGWSQPNCEAMDKLEDESKFRCNNLDFSDPLYEEVLGYYSAASDPTYTDHTQLTGKSICRAEAFTLAPLEEVELVAPVISIVRAPTAADCINFVIEGKADVALVAVDAADRRISSLNASALVQMHDDLTYVDVLHAVIAKSHPQNEEILAVVNNGLANIKDSGLWFETVRRHMTAFRALSQ